MAAEQLLLATMKHLQPRSDQTETGLYLKERCHCQEGLWEVGLKIYLGGRAIQMEQSIVYFFVCNLWLLRN